MIRIQVLCLAILWVVNTIKAISIGFPLMVSCSLLALWLFIRIQVLCLAILRVVKTIKAISIGFPLMVSCSLLAPLVVIRDKYTLVNIIQVVLSFMANIKTISSEAESRIPFVTSSSMLVSLTVVRNQYIAIIQDHGAVVSNYMLPRSKCRTLLFSPLFMDLVSIGGIRVTKSRKSSFLSSFNLKLGYQIKRKNASTVSSSHKPLQFCYYSLP